MDLNRLEQILDRASSRRITVIGDLMLDEFVWGKVGRLSPEAPVPVVEVTGESFYPGGAANAARNLREFVDHVEVIGLFGKDASGRQLRDLLAQQKIDMSNAIEDETFRTILKTRIIARHQQVVRVDREQIVVPTPEQTAKVVAAIRKKISDIDAIIFADYGKGFLTTELVSEIAREGRASGTIVAADPNPRHLIDWRALSRAAIALALDADANPRHFIDWRGMTALTPNRTEAFLAADIQWRDPDGSPTEDVDLMRAGKALLEKVDTQYVLITLGPHGMMLFQNSEPPHHIPTKARQVFDVSGAGDTAIALFTLALACEATPIEAAEIANHGSGIVVGKLGTATVTRDELIAGFREDSKHD
jgi:D-beta-D-heptose 7-phosphate kinase/D-beta-D-heptose 1-phosphate adenosyltransferase